YSLYSSSLFFTHTPTTQISTLSLHDALPILGFSPDGKRLALLDADKIIVWDLESGKEVWSVLGKLGKDENQGPRFDWSADGKRIDRKSTRLNSSHSQISYAVFCLKKKKKIQKKHHRNHRHTSPGYPTNYPHYHRHLRRLPNAHAPRLGYRTSRPLLTSPNVQ